MYSQKLCPLLLSARSSRQQVLKLANVLIQARQHSPVTWTQAWPPSKTAPVPPTNILLTRSFWRQGGSFMVFLWLRKHHRTTSTDGLPRHSGLPKHMGLCVQKRQRHQNQAVDCLRRRREHGLNDCSDTKQLCKSMTASAQSCQGTTRKTKNDCRPPRRMHVRHLAVLGDPDMQQGPASRKGQPTTAESHSSSFPPQGGYDPPKTPFPQADQLCELLVQVASTCFLDKQNSQQFGVNFNYLEIPKTW